MLTLIKDICLKADRETERERETKRQRERERERERDRERQRDLFGWFLNVLVNN